MKKLLLSLSFLPLLLIGQVQLQNAQVSNFQVVPVGSAGPTTAPTFVTAITETHGAYGDFSASIAVGSESSRVMVSVVTLAASGQSSTVTGVSFNGTAMTDCGDGLVWDGSGNAVKMFYLINPANVTGQVTITGSESGLSQVAIWTGYFSGAAQVSTISSHASATGSSSTASITVSGGAGQMVIDAENAAAYSTLNPYSNRTINSYFGGGRSSSSYLIPSNSSSVMDWPFGSSTTWCEIAIGVNGL